MTMRSDLLQHRGVLVGDDVAYLDLAHYHSALIKELQKKAGE